jgi:hypothetical protein
MSSIHLTSLSERIAFWSTVSHKHVSAPSPPLPLSPREINKKHQEYSFSATNSYFQRVSIFMTTISPHCPASDLHVSSSQSLSCAISSSRDLRDFPFLLSNALCSGMTGSLAELAGAHSLNFKTSRNSTVAQLHRNVSSKGTMKRSKF